MNTMSTTNMMNNTQKVYDLTNQSDLLSGFYYAAYKELILYKSRGYTSGNWADGLGLCDNLRMYLSRIGANELVKQKTMNELHQQFADAVLYIIYPFNKVKVGFEWVQDPSVLPYEDEKQSFNNPHRVAWIEGHVKSFEDEKL